MFGAAAWRRHRSARAKAAAERKMRELRGRAAIRQAEDIVEAAWVEELGHADRADPRVRRLLARERSAFAAAARRRAAEAEADWRRLAAIAKEFAEIPGRVPPTG
jgi:hypothetical protein